MERNHFIGIGGIGVSALAQVALARGVGVSGSDLRADPHSNPAIARLMEGGATVYSEHRRENIAPDVTLVISSAAITPDNPEIAEAQRRGIRIVSRAEYLGELMAAHPGPKIAVAGTHGKTTTTGMIGVMLQEAGLDPTVFVGGEVPQLGGNARIGSPNGPFVAEACEAYDSFLYLKPDIVVITNIEADHLDHYGTYENVLNAFRKFACNAKETVIACADSPGVHDALDGMDAKSLHPLYYAIDNAEVDARARNIVLSDQPTFDWRHEWEDSTRVQLSVPGLHNVYNALAAATLGRILNIPGKNIARFLSEFRGAGRRQDILGEVKFGDSTVLVMDDYAHHPTEIRVTLEAMRSAYPERRLVAVFQPHLYSRTRDFLPEFGEELAKADALFVTDIYAAREAPIPGVRAADIITQASHRNRDLPGVFLPDKQDIPAALEGFVQPNDLCVFMGAGDIRAQGESFVQLLKAKETER